MPANDVAFGDGMLTDLFAGKLHPNLHALDYGSGEICGPLSAVPIPAPLVFLGLPLSIIARLRGGF
ncbi:MAG: hypothetical protein ACU84Q_21475 [Gammaproteobacteria bacterium]